MGGDPALQTDDITSDRKIFLGNRWKGERGGHACPHFLTPTEKQLTKKYFANVSKTMMSNHSEIIQPDDIDILCERGGLSNNHPGCQMYLSVVQHNKGIYQKLKNDQHKHFLAESIFLAIEKTGARFLQQDKERKIWIKIDRKKAITKIKQRLRERKTSQSWQPSQQTTTAGHTPSSPTREIEFSEAVCVSDDSTSTSSTDTSISSSPQGDDLDVLDDPYWNNDHSGLLEQFYADPLLPNPSDYGIASKC